MTTENPNPAPTPAPTGTPPAPPVAPAAATPPKGDASPADDKAPDLDALRAEMKRDRFDAAAARGGVDEGYTDVALELFNKSGKEPTKENMSAFIAELKKSKPALFGPQPANTAPTPTAPTPATPAPGGAATPYQQWRALLDAGRKAEAEAFYLQHRDQIRRSA